MKKASLLISLSLICQSLIASEDYQAEVFIYEITSELSSIEALPSSNSELSDFEKREDVSLMTSPKTILNNDEVTSISIGQEFTSPADGVFSLIEGVDILIQSNLTQGAVDFEAHVVIRKFSGLVENEKDNHSAIFDTKEALIGAKKAALDTPLFFAIPNDDNTFLLVLRFDTVAED